MPARSNGPVSSNVSHHRIPQLTQLSSFLVTHISGLRNSAKLRRRLEVSSWLALRAVAHCASSVHSVAAQGASWRDASTLLNLEAKSSKFAAGGEHLNLKSVPRLSKIDDGCRHGKAQLQQLVRGLRSFVRRARRIGARSSGTGEPRMEKQQVGSRWRTLGFEVRATVEQSRRQLPSRQSASTKANHTISPIGGACVVHRGRL